MKEVISFLFLGIGLGGGYFLGLAAALLLIPVLLVSALVYAVIGIKRLWPVPQGAPSNITNLKDYDLGPQGKLVYQLGDDIEMIESEPQRKPAWWINT